MFVETLFSVYKKYNELVSGPFKNDPGFVAAMDKACRRFINDNAICKKANNGPSKSPELFGSLH